ncbi:MAG: HEAT repeat domain-containing protein [Armatimonadota bacterium]
MRVALTCLIMLTASIAPPVAAQSEEAAAPPSPHEAAFVVAGEPDHDREQPVGVIAGHVYALPALIEGLALDDPLMRARCAFLLGQIASPDGTDALRQALNDSDRDVRMFAGMALARMGDSDGLPAAHAAYYGNRWWIRYWAIDALARLDRVPEVALEDPDPLVRGIAEDGRRGGWEPASATAEYPGPVDASLDDIIFNFTTYMVGETDWWWHAGHYEQIIRGNETIVWLDPEFLDGLTNSAYLYWSLERDVEALATYRRAVSMHPDEWEAHFELGFFYFNAQRRFADAVPLFKRARELGAPPERARLHAHALEKSGRVDEAYEVWRELVANTPDDPVARQNLQRLKEIIGSG